MFKQIKINNKETLYFVSDEGDVLSRYKNKCKRLKIFETDSGYLYVKLWINGKSKAEFVHRLVAKHFIPNPENKPEVNHKDGNKKNNQLSNLEWVTSKENKLHAKLNNLTNYAKLENAGKSIYTNKQIEKVCLLLEENKKTIKEISRICSVSEDTIYAIRTKGIWKEISKKYKIPKTQTRKNSAYSEKDIINVCKLLEKGDITIKEISNLTGVKKCTILDVKHKRRWKYVSDDYKI